MRIELKNRDLIKASLVNQLSIDKARYDFKGLSIDSRNIKDKDIFVALQGERSHGNDFIDKKLLKKVSLVISDKYFKHDKVFTVNNSKEFLVQLATFYRKKIQSKFICITGTNGKTTTKELLADILKEKYKVNYSKGNFNSTISLPLSLLSFNDISDYSIMEMGASKSGEINLLSNISRPNIGLITNISKAHLEGFESFKDLVNTKLAICDYLAKSEGVYFLNKDDPNIVGNTAVDAIENIMSFSTYNENVDYFGDMSKLEKGILTINDKAFKIPYKTTSFVYNFLASYSIASFLGVDEKSIQNSLYKFKLPTGRGDVIKVEEAVIINDSYNANLQSMKSGISDINSINVKKRKVILILGDMLELGDCKIKIHEELGEYISSLDFIDTVYGIGMLIKKTIDSIDNKKIEKKYFSNKELLVCDLENKDKDGIYYFKGSRGMHIDIIIRKVFGDVV